MFCVNCGAAQDASWKFCNQCGQANSPAKSIESNQLVENAFSSNENTKSEARDKIIEIGSEKIFRECIAIATAKNQLEDSIFWYYELITAADLENEYRDKLAAEFIDEILIKNELYVEAEFYLNLIARRNREKPKYLDELTKKIQSMSSASVRMPFDRENIFPFREGLKPDSSPSDQYMAGITNVLNFPNVNLFDELCNAQSDEYWHNWIGYLIGLKDGLKQIGLGFEYILQGINDGLKIIDGQFVMPKQFKTECVSQILRALPNPLEPRELNVLIHGSNEPEKLISLLNVSSKVGDGVQGKEEVIVFTTSRAFIYTPKSFFQEGSAQNVKKWDLQFLAFGDSSHLQQAGFVNRVSEWVTLTFVLNSGQQITRHFYLGSDPKQIDVRMGTINNLINKLTEHNYPLGEGGGINSSAGYRISYGIGVFNAID